VYKEDQTQNYEPGKTSYTPFSVSPLQQNSRACHYYKRRLVIIYCLASVITT